MKKGIRFSAFLMCLLILFSGIFGVFAEEISESSEVSEEQIETPEVPEVPLIDSAISAGIDYYKNVQKALYEADMSIMGTPFHAMLRAETSMIQQSDYFFMVPVYDISTVGAFTKSEEFAKAIIVCTLSGQNPRTAVGGMDMIEKLISLQGTDGRFMFINEDGGSEFSMEGHLWAMIALDMVNADYNRTKAINSLFSYKYPAGGFAEPAASAPSIDISSLAVLALSKYTNPRIIEVRNVCVEFLRSTYIGGVFSPVDGGSANVVTQSYAIMALIAAGEGIWNEPYTTAEFSPMDYLLACQDETGGFWYSKDIRESGGAAGHTAAEDYASAVSLCALLDIKNTRSYYMNVGEKFVDTTHTVLEEEPNVIVFEAKYVWTVAGLVVAVLIFVCLFGMFFSGKQGKHKIKKLKKTLQK